MIQREELKSSTRSSEQEKSDNLVAKLFADQRAHKYHLKNTSFAYRAMKLRAVKRKILELQGEIERALELDFSKASAETCLTEILPVLSMINLYCKKLKYWMRPKAVSSSLLFLGTRAYVSYEAKGNCLVLSPWNYPFQLAMYPVLTAFAAGNTVILKPSEYTAHTNHIIKKIISDVFAPEEVSVVEGEVEVASTLLDLPFDHIFFTGSTAVGKVVMRKASENLSSVALELGGKSPVIIDTDYSIEAAAKNLVWGKYVNAGQTCVAPDYVLLPKGSRDGFLLAFKKALETSYANEFKDNPDYCRMISSRHAKRLRELVDDALCSGAEILYGGELLDNGKLMPTVLGAVTEEMQVMQEEIFGPILPVIEYESLEQAVEFINRYEHALALYVFSDKKKNIEFIRERTSSGAYSINETLMHVGHPSLPFGGVGQSGIGKYHGKSGFEEMSHPRAVLHRKFKAGAELFYPPYTERKKRWIDKVLRFL